MKDVRLKLLDKWAETLDLDCIRVAGANLEPVSDDASFRRYFRYSEGSEGIVFVDAPPEHEDNESFIKVAAAILARGLNCPVVQDYDLEHGFLAISDLGNRIYLTTMLSDPAQIPRLYHDAIGALVSLQDVSCDLPTYDELRLRDELSLFDQWFLSQQLGVQLSDSDQQMLSQLYDLLTDSALAQPQCFVHRDYHCRNLMISDLQNPGIIDFQDAVKGPVTYDLVSLYKDCYYRFDRKDVLTAVDSFHQQLVQSGKLGKDIPMLRWFDLMGAQRHLKCAGIFSRLNLRDGKPGYLADIPLVIDYLIDCAGLYTEMAEFGRWLAEEIKPRLNSPQYQRMQS